jgi:hypothetical protein
MTRYSALIRVCDWACAYAAEHGADSRPEFFETLSAALHDDCPQQSQAAGRVAASMRVAHHDRATFVHLIQTPEVCE